jgi:hypothetical protein
MTQESLAMTQESLDIETRIAKLEAINDIRGLKLAYAVACDDSYNAEVLSAMFAEDAVWDGGDAFGTYRGRPAIKDYFAGLSSKITWAMHYTMGGDIKVDDDVRTASGTWQLWLTASLVVDGEPQAVVMSANYRDTYVREDDGWKFQTLAADFTMATRLDVGWAPSQFTL